MYLGTSGFSYNDWVGNFYPMGMPKREWLGYLDLGFCCVDEPPLPNLLPPVAEATSKIGYVRFHGRNSAKWWQHEHAYERYDYSYTPQEISDWVPKSKKAR